MSEKKQTWKDAARRTRQGKKHELETLPGYYFHPVKFSVEGNDEIVAISLKKKEGLSPKTLKKIREIAGAKKDMSEAEIINSIPDDDLLEILRESDAKLLNSAELKRAKIKHGFGKNNFEGVDNEGAEGKKGVSDDFIDDILQHVEVVNEIVGAIEVWNRPLALGQSES